MQTKPQPFTPAPPFSSVVMDHFLHPRGTGGMDNPSGSGMAGSLASHQYMGMQVRVENGVVQAAAFNTYGCAPAIAAGSYVCEWVAGQTVTAAMALTADQLTTMLGGLPAARACCATLAVDALQAALKDAEPAATDPAPTPASPTTPPPPTSSPPSKSS